MQVQISAKRHNAPQGKLNDQTATAANGQGREGFLSLAVFFARSLLRCLPHRGRTIKAAGELVAGGHSIGNARGRAAYRLVLFAPLHAR